MPRNFDGAGDFINLSAGNSPPTSSANFLFACLVRRDVTSAWHGILSILNGTGGNLLAFEFNNSANDFSITADNSPNPYNLSTNVGANGVAASKWWLIVAFKQGGTGAIDIEILDVAAGTWTQTLTSSVTGGAITTSSMRIGRWEATDDYDGDIAWIAFWNTLPAQLNNQTKINAFFQHATIAQILQANPSSMWVLDQGATTTNVNDLTGNGANQSSVTGTTVSTLAAPIVGYGASIIQMTTSAPAAGGTAVKDILSMGVLAFAR